MKNYNSVSPRGFKTPSHAASHNSLLVLLDDLTSMQTISIKRLCAWLDISYKTMTRYIAGTSPVPPSVCFALFWESKWGRDSVYCDMKNQFDLMVMQRNTFEAKARALEMEVNRLASQIKSAANAPIYTVGNTGAMLAPKPNAATLRHPETRTESVRHAFREFKIRQRG